MSVRQRKRDRQRARRDRVARGDRVQGRKLAPEVRCPKCGSRMGRAKGGLDELVARGARLKQPVVCGNGHVWVRKESPRSVSERKREEIRREGVA